MTQNDYGVLFVKWSVLVVGGGNITSSWVLTIPAAIAQTSPGGAILLGSLCIIVAILGFPMDVAVWPPVMRKLCYL